MNNIIVRGEAVEIICMNMVMANQLPFGDLNRYMANLCRVDNETLAQLVVYSRGVLDEHYQDCFSKN